MKYAWLLILLFSPFSIGYTQNIHLELGRAFNGNGDVRLWSFGMSQDISRFQIGGKLLYGTGDRLFRTPDEELLFPIVDNQGNYLFDNISTPPGSPSDRGLATFKVKSDRHLHAYLNANYRLLSTSFGAENRFEFQLRVC
jgi:hypothetical protein